MDRDTNEARTPVGGTAHQAGFTLAELLVTLGVLVVVILGVLALFDLNSRIARTQTHVAEMQQSQRVAQQSVLRLARMAGRGGLLHFDGPAGKNLPDGVAVAVDNNVGAGTKIAGCDCAEVLPGTDVLTVRGVFSSPVYHSDPLDDTVYDAAAGTVRLTNRTPTGGEQPLDDIAEAVDRAEGGNGTDAMLLVSPLGEYLVVEVTGGDKVTGTGGEITQVTVEFASGSGSYADEFQELSYGGSTPPGFGQVAQSGLLEEYRFYIRRRAGLSPQLVRARLYPNTDTAFLGSDANLTEVIADGIMDLQVALGVDRDGDEVVEEDPTNPGGDEWLFNSAGDNTTAANWNFNDGERGLFYVRVSTLARTDRPTPQYQADLLGQIEDKDYTTSPYDVANDREQRSYQRRQLRSTVDLRNL